VTRKTCAKEQKNPGRKGKRKVNRAKTMKTTRSMNKGLRDRTQGGEQNHTIKTTGFPKRGMRQKRNEKYCHVVGNSGRGRSEEGPRTHAGTTGENSLEVIWEVIFINI